MYKNKEIINYYILEISYLEEWTKYKNQGKFRRKNYNFNKYFDRGVVKKLKKQR